MKLFTAVFYHIIPIIFNLLIVIMYVTSTYFFGNFYISLFLSPNYIAVMCCFYIKILLIRNNTVKSAQMNILLFDFSILLQKQEYNLIFIAIKLIYME